MLELTILEASKRLGVATDTIRRRIIKGGLKARKVSSPHGNMYLVELPDDTPPGPAAPQRESTLEALRKTVSILETELEARRREVQELHLLLQQAQRQLPAGKREEEEAAAGMHWWRRLFRRSNK